MKSYPIVTKENEHKINKLAIPEYFEDYMMRRPANKSGYINMAIPNFKSMLSKAETKEDFATLMTAWVNFVGHRNKLPFEEGDLLLAKALKNGH